MVNTASGSAVTHGSTDRLSAVSADERLQLTVTDLKRYIYCPREVFFTYVLPVEVRTTRKMEYGKLEHLDFAQLERRRGFKKYGLEDGKRNFNVSLHSPRLGLRGILDLLITSPHGELFPVEVKNTFHFLHLGYKYQMTAYAMLVEDMLRKPVRQGYIYLIPRKKAYCVEITSSMRLFLKRMLSAINNMVRDEKFPVVPRSWRRCRDCEFRNYCGDIP